MERSGFLKRRFLAAAGVFIAAGALFAAVQISGLAPRTLEIIARSGPLAPLLFLGLFTAACVFMLPTFYLTIGAGFLFGPLTGFIVASFSVITGATAAFLAARAGSDRAAGKILASPGFAALREAVDEEGWKIVFLCRLSPILPFNLLNYAFGLSDIPLSRYFFATWAGSIPWTALYVYMGSMAADLAGLSGAPVIPTGGLARLFYWAGIAATTGATVMAGRIARKALRRRLRDNNPGKKEEG